MVEKVASHSIHAYSLIIVGQTALCLILRVLVFVLPQFVNPMRKLALEAIIASAIPDEVLTELVLEFLITLVF